MSKDKKAGTKVPAFLFTIRGSFISNHNPLLKPELTIITEKNLNISNLNPVYFPSRISMILLAFARYICSRVWSSKYSPLKGQ